jgi:hypothetical protein
MLRANPRVLGTALFSALGLLPLSCGGSFSGKQDAEGGGGGSDGGGKASGGASAAAGKPSGGSSSTAGKGSGGAQAMGGSNSAGTASAGTPSGGASPEYPCEMPSASGAGYEHCDNGTVHRPAVKECASKLPRSDSSAKIAPGGTCTQDTDCADRPHGYCSLSGQLPGPVCLYGCVKDSECAAGSICLCGDPVGQCVGSSCTSDADCGAGFRCQSYDSSHGCGIMRFACQTADDTCGSDADCAGGFCDGMNGRFTCVQGACAIGRPFLVEGEERVAGVIPSAEWLQAFAVDTTALAPTLRDRLARAWARMGQLEHASIAAFARFSLQLLSLGAPPELIERTTRAMVDETRHARQAFGIASAFAGEALGPAELDIERSLGATTLAEVVRLVVREGCIGETGAALEAREAAAHAADPALARVLHAVADDESQHAELAWRFVSWALERAPDDVAHVLRSELSRAEPAPASRSEPSADELAALAYGVVPPCLRQQLEVSAFREVIGPCAEALLRRGASKPAENLAVSA